VALAQVTRNANDRHPGFLSQLRHVLWRLAERGLLVQPSLGREHEVCLADTLPDAGCFAHHHRAAL
jgi:hypothetical protein